MNLQGKLVTFKSKHGVAIARVTSHDTDTNVLLVHDAVLVDTLKPLKFLWGGRTLPLSRVIPLDIPSFNF